MRPYIICHMMQSVDGRIDCAMTAKIDDTDNYYDALDALECPSHLSGKTTMAMHVQRGTGLCCMHGIKIPCYPILAADRRAAP